LTTIVTSNPERRGRAKRDHPAAQVVSNPEDVFSQMSRHDLVVIATSNSTHVPLALAAGQAVVVDKPMASQRRLDGSSSRRGVGASSSACTTSGAGTATP
jgi:predicted dehydrogenase